MAPWQVSARVENGTLSDRARWATGSREQRELVDRPSAAARADLVEASEARETGPDADWHHVAPVSLATRMYVRSSVETATLKVRKIVPLFFITSCSCEACSTIVFASSCGQCHGHPSMDRRTFVNVGRTSDATVSKSGRF